MDAGKPVGKARQALRAAGLLARVIALALCTAILITGCMERGAHIQGTSGPVAWQVTDLRVVEREVAGTPRDLYAFTLVLTETQGSPLIFTQMERTISQPGVNTSGISEPFAIRWQLRPYGEVRQPFASFWYCTGADCGFLRTIPPAPWYTIVLTGTDERSQPVRVVIDFRLPSNPPKQKMAQSKETPAPPPPSTASTPAGDSGPAPFQTVGNRIFVPAMLNAKEHVTLLVDTGAAYTFLTPDTAKRLGISPPADAPKRATTVVGGRQVEFPLVQLSTIAIGDAVMENLQVGILASFPNSPLVDGILGGSFLQHFTMTLDYATSRLRLVPKDTSRTSPATTAVVPVVVSKAVPIHIVGNHVLVRAVLNLQEHVTLLLDTGATRTILTPGTAQRLGLSPPADAPRERGTVADGKTLEVPLVPLASLAVGEAVVENLQVGVAEVNPRASTVEGLLGGDFLGQFAITLDRTTRHLWLEAYQGAKRQGRDDDAKKHLQ